MARPASHDDATEDGAHRVAENVARHSYGKLVAFLAARMRDVAGAEDALSDAFAAALKEWPVRGVPDAPEAWLMTVAKRKAIDAARRRRTKADSAPHLALIAEELEAAAASVAALPDERLGLMFACAHPALDANVRAPLILQTILGFDAAAIASAFLVSPASMSQRLVRAKSKIKQAGIPFRLPDASELRERLEAVLDSIYAGFAEGWSDPQGTDAPDRNLSEEAIWLGRLVAAALPEEPEALGLVALMLHSQARRAARRDGNGDYVPLAEQDTTLWDTAAIEEAEALLLRASRMGASGRYQMEAAVQSAHAVRRKTGRSDWAAIVALYDVLMMLTGSPVVAINRAAALAELRGPRAGLQALDAISEDGRLNQYQPYWAVRASVLAGCGETAAANDAYERAIGLSTDPAVRRFLQKKQAVLAA